MANCNFCGQITNSAHEVRADILVFCNEKHSHAWYNREVTKETEAAEAIDMVDDIRYLIIAIGGMATKSLVEKILQTRWPDLSDDEARDLTNGAEYAAKRAFRLNPLRWTSVRPEPDLADWPEVRDFQPECKYVETPRTTFRLSRQFHVVRLLYRSGSIQPDDAALIAHNYSFLIPMNAKVGAAALAKEIRNYSSSQQAKYLAGVLEKIAQKESDGRSN